MNIHSIETFGTQEGPGIRYVLFVQGCNYKCLYCHNPDTQCLNKNIEMSTEEIIAQVMKNVPFFGTKGGITVSGGEPLLQAKELTELFTGLQRLGVNTCLDTNGSILTEKTKVLLNHTDLVILDIKEADPKLHSTVTGVASDAIPSIDFAKYLNKINKPFWVRYVLVPGYTDDSESLERLASILKDFKSLERIEILPYHTLGIHKYKELKMNYKLTDIETPTLEQIESAKNILAKSGKKVFVR
ncbi:MAG: pyruvate formate-lyase-activating protein [Candidatus Berkelbacteria bacterium]